MPISRLKDFVQHEAAGGVILMGVAVLALVCANITLTQEFYQTLTQPMVKLIINDVLMSVFFLLVGLELKRECLIGELSGRQRLLQPLFAAIGGMIVPVAMYLICTKADPLYRAGWAIAAATDIAFALGVVTLLGRKRMPKHIVILLTALAILDDIGAIAVIAVFYSQGLVWSWLLLAFMALVVLWVLNRRTVHRLTPYLICGCVVWLGFFKGGLHPTLAGVATAMFVPLRDHSGRVDSHSSLYRLENSLHNVVAYAVLPLFAFVNAGLSLHGLSIVDIGRPVTLGVLLGLCVGKPLGILGGLWIGRLTGVLKPVTRSVDSRALAAMACLCGIGFTMSLFINDLAFVDDGLQNQAKLGVLLASLLATVCGISIAWKSKS